MATAGSAAALGSVAKINPDVIRQTVVDLGDGTFGVRFYDRARGKVRVRPGGRRSAGRHGAAELHEARPRRCAISAPIIEKAYTFVFQKTGNYQDLDGGWMENFFYDLSVQLHVNERDSEADDRPAPDDRLVPEPSLERGRPSRCRRSRSSSDLPVPARSQDCTTARSSRTMPTWLRVSAPTRAATRYRSRSATRGASMASAADRRHRTGTSRSTVGQFNNCVNHGTAATV